MRRLLLLALPGSLLALLGLAPSAPAANDIFLEVSGMTGESTDAKFGKSADIAAFSWGITRSGVTRNRPAGAPKFTDFSVTKYVDTMSPPLMQKAADGSSISTVKLSVRKSGTSNVYQTFCLADATVQSIQSGGTGGEDRLTENVSFRFSTIVQRYTVQNKDGSLGTPAFAGWNLLSATPLTTGC